MKKKSKDLCCVCNNLIDRRLRPKNSKTCSKRCSRIKTLEYRKSFIKHPERCRKEYKLTGIYAF